MTSSLHLKNALLLGTAIYFGIGSGHGLAQSNEITLDTVTVIATKTKDAVVDTLSGTSVVNQETVRRTQPSLISEFLNGVPGVSVQEDTDSPGSSINIRGLQDFGRVNVMIDGARQNFQASGHGADGTFYIDPALIQQVDIVRGPVATIYGSGAIGGVVNFKLKEGTDIVLPGETWAARQKLSFATNDKEFLTSTTLAAKPSESFNVIANLVYRKDWNYKDGKGNRIINTGDDVTAGYAKAVFTPGNGHTLKLGVLHQKNNYTTGTSGTQRKTDTIDKTGTFKWLYNAPSNPWIDFSLSTYVTSTDSNQLRLDGALAGNKRFFKVLTYGFDAFNTSLFDTGSLNHKVTYGGDYFKDKVTTGDAGGPGAQFTPKGKRFAYGLFVQDQVQVTNWLRFVGALRFDGYQADGTDLNTGNAIKITGTRLSPKATIGIAPTKSIEFYGTYAEGYRAPAITETLNSGLHPAPINFTFLPNPNLTPETASNFEGGVNFKFDNVVRDTDKFRAKASVYHNTVKDFIEGVTFGNCNVYPVPPTCFFQYQNLAKVRLQGIELEANYDAGFMFAKLAYTYTDGKDLETKMPLGSVRPHKLVSTLGFRFLENKLTTGVTWTAVAAKKASDIPANASANAVPTDAFNVVDLFATYKHNRYFSTAVTLKNVLDENYNKYLNLNASEGFSAVFSATIQLGG